MLANQVDTNSATTTILVWYILIYFISEWVRKSYYSSMNAKKHFENITIMYWEDIYVFSFLNIYYWANILILQVKERKSFHKYFSSKSIWVSED